MTPRNRISLRHIALLVAVVAATLALVASTSTAETTVVSAQASAVTEPDAAQPVVITYQGRLLDPATGVAKPDAPYNATFGLYDVEAGGSPLWNEVQPVVTNNGLFSVTLGNQVGNPIQPSLFNGSARWLSIYIDGVELLPRVRVAHSPYAIWSNLSGSASVAQLAGDSQRLGGRLPADYTLLGHAHDAGDIASGNLSTDRYHAIDDLGAEGYLGNATGDIAMNNGILQPRLNAEYLNGVAASGYAVATHTHKGTDIVDGSIGTADLADASVTSAKIADGNVGAADLANSAVTLAKISSAGATAKKVIQYNGSTLLWDYAPGSEIKFTVLDVPNVGLTSFGTAYTKLTNIGSVSKVDASSRLEVTFNGRIYVGSMTGNGVRFELRVDDAATTNGRARANVRSTEVGGGGVPVSIMGIFTGLGAGTHTLSIWVQTSTGTGANATLEPGGWSSDHVVVREIK